MKRLLLNGFMILAGAGIGAVVTAEYMNQIVREKHIQGDNYHVLYQMMERWLICKQNKKNLEEYFLKHGYHRIGVYGLGRIGTMFVNELKDTSIEIVYGVDRRKDVDIDFDFYHSEQDLPEADAIVITAMTYIDEIEDLLMNKVKYPIISIEEVLYGV